ncbi:MAG: TonB-dependent receptor, partial [Pseudomonadales bacterium]
MIRPFQPVFLRPLILPLAALALPVAAVDEAGPIETIVVRGAYFGQALAEGVKTPTLLLNVPQSVSVMDAQQLREQAHVNMVDAMQYTPGVSIGQGEDHRDQLTIRGQNTTADFFLDGLRDDVQYFRPLYNLERVEVLRGANALLFGRGGGGGVVNRVSKVPTMAEAFTTVSANVDSFGAEGLSLDLNRPLGGQGAFRLNALADGDMKNHRDYKDGERFALNPTVSWLTKDGTLLNASYEWLDDDRVVDRGIPSVDGAPLGGARDTFFADPSVNRTTFGGHIARLRAERSFGPNWRV